MKIIDFFLLLFVLMTFTLDAQIKDPSYSFYVQPGFQNRIITFKGSFSASYKDSIRKADQGRLTVGAGFLYSFQTGKKTRFYTGLQYQEMGFSRIKENLKFLDTIHPQIGLMFDQSQTGGNYVDFKYRFKYLSLPLMFSNDLSRRKSKNTRIHATYGLSVSVLIEHDILAKLHGFSTRGSQKKFKLDNSESEPGRINANLMGGFRVENLLYGKETWVFISPEIMIPTLPANLGKERYRLWSLGLQIGIYYRPDKTEKKE